MPCTCRSRSSSGERPRLAIQEDDLDPGRRQLVEQQHLVGILAGQAIGRQDGHDVEEPGLGVVAQPIERRPVEAGAAEAAVAVGVLIGEVVPLLAHPGRQDRDLAVDRLLQVLALGRDAGIDRGFHRRPPRGRPQATGGTLAQAGAGRRERGRRRSGSTTRPVMRGEHGAARRHLPERGTDLWGTPLPAGKARAIALEERGAEGNGMATISAMVHTVSVSRQGKVRLERVDVAHETGFGLVNPLSVKKQIEGQIAWFYNDAMHQATTIAGGHVVENNFNTFPLSRISEDPPEINIRFFPTQHWLIGMGHDRATSVQSAIGDAIFQITGKRVRISRTENTT